MFYFLEIDFSDLKKLIFDVLHKKIGQKIKKWRDPPETAAILDAILNISNSSTRPAGHRPDSDSMCLPLPKSAKTCLGVFFVRLTFPAAGLLHINEIFHLLLYSLHCFCELSGDTYTTLLNVLCDIAHQQHCKVINYG